MNLTNTFRTDVFRSAWALARKTGLAFAEALRQAWQWVKLRAALAKGTVTVTFRKIDGTPTTRTATRCTGLIPAEHAPKGSRPENGTLAFYSLTDNGWRSLTLAGLVSFTIN